MPDNVTYTMSNRIVVILDLQNMEISYGANISKVYLNSYLTKEFVVRPNLPLGPAQSLWVTFANNADFNAATLKTAPTLMAYRQIANDGTREVTDDGASVTQIEQIPNVGMEYYLQIPQAVLQNVGTWYFSLQVREIPDENNPTVFTVQSTSDVGSFIVNNSLSSASGGAPTDLDILSLYNTLVSRKDVPLVHRQIISTTTPWSEGFHWTAGLDTFNRPPKVNDNFLSFIDSQDTRFAVLSRVTGIGTIAAASVVVAVYPSVEYIEALLTGYAKLNGGNNFVGSQNIIGRLLVEGQLYLTPFEDNGEFKTMISFEISDQTVHLQPQYNEDGVDLLLPAQSGTIALQSDIPPIDKEVSETSTNPVENRAIPSYVEQAILAGQEPLIDRINDNEEQITDIKQKIPATASAQNQLADKEFVNSSINSVTAYYITYNAAGDPFPTKAALDAATSYYYAGAVRTPTKNDYCVVLSDETHGNATVRYVYQENNGTGVWAFQYIVNSTPLTAAQLAVLNSGITASLVTTYNNHVANKSNPHAVTKGQVGLGNVDNVKQYSASNLPPLHDTIALTNQNLDDYHGVSYVGWYYGGGGNTVTGLPAEIPTGSGRYFGLEIQRGAGGLFIQKLQYGNVSYVRYYSGGWTDWMKMYSTANKPTAADIGAVSLSGDQFVVGTNATVQKKYIKFASCTVTSAWQTYFTRIEFADSNYVNTITNPCGVEIAVKSTNTELTISTRLLYGWRAFLDKIYVRYTPAYSGGNSVVDFYYETSSTLAYDTMLIKPLWYWSRANVAGDANPFVYDTSNTMVDAIPTGTGVTTRTLTAASYYSAPTSNVSLYRHNIQFTVEETIVSRSFTVTATGRVSYLSNSSTPYSSISDVLRNPTITGFNCVIESAIEQDGTELKCTGAFTNNYEDLELSGVVEQQDGAHVYSTICSAKTFVDNVTQEL